MTRYPSILLIPLFLAGFFTTGCQTTVGNYFANRGRDLGECFLVQGGLALGLVGVQANVAGLAHVGGILVAHNRALSGGWVYGDPRPTDEARVLTHGARMEGDIGIPISLFIPARALHVSMLPGDRGGHACYGLLPALFSWTGEDETGKTWLWSGENEDPILGRWARVHAFDIEVGASALFFSARVGFSPGEFLDFLLGWFGLDIAGDDKSRTEATST